MNKTLCIVAGSSGGHILPAFMLAQKRQQDRPGGSILFFSGTKTLDEQLSRNAPTRTEHHTLHLPPFPGKKIWHYPAYAVALLRASLSALIILRRAHVGKIISTGGQISIPVCLAGRLLGIPCEVYELNAEPGRALTVLGRLAQNIFHVFVETKGLLPKTLHKKCVHTLYPLRYDKEHTATKEELCAFLRLSTEHKTLLVLGGSQGARQINDLVKQYIKTSAPKNLQVIHQLGDQEVVAAWQKFYEHCQIPSHVFTFKDDLAPCYQLADYVIARAGAGTLFELLHFQKHAALMPLTAATTNHQVMNAKAMCQQYPNLFTLVGSRPDLQEIRAVIEKNLY